MSRRVNLCARRICVSLSRPGLTFERLLSPLSGAIAMQGVRQAEVTIGDHVAVIGLGLVGILTVQILKSAGLSSDRFGHQP